MGNESTAGRELPEGWSEGDLTLDEVTLHYYRAQCIKHDRVREPLTLVFIHGATDNGLCWRRAALELQKDYELVLLDLRGHGKSGTPRTGHGYTSCNYASDTIAVAEALHLGAPVLIGHSMGAETAAVAASMFPERIRAIVLEDPPWYDDEEDSVLRRKRATMWREEILKRKLMPVERIVAEGRALHPGWHDMEWGPWAESKLQVNSNMVEYVEKPRPPGELLAPCIKCPALLLTGDPEKGSIVTVSMADQVVKTGHTFTAVHIAGAGHSIRREKFDAYIREVKRFIAGLQL